MLKKLYKINKQYDDMREPYRFYVMLVICVPLIIISKLSIVFMIFAYTCMISLIVIRYMHVKGKLRKYIKKIDNK